MEYTKKQKDMIRKYAPNIASILFDEDNKEDRAFIRELEIRHAIKSATNQETYLGLEKIARAIKEGIGEDLLPLIKCLCKLCPSKIRKQVKK